MATSEIAVTGVSISEAARLTGTSVHTLRYYDRVGLMLDPIGRAASSHRRYSAADIGWVTLLMRLRATGMSIGTVREYGALVRAGDGNEAERLRLLEAHRDAVRHRLAETELHLAAVDEKIAIYRESIDQ
jgi:DNA-binding transcriptional MerR regulator